MRIAAAHLSSMLGKSSSLWLRPTSPADLEAPRAGVCCTFGRGGDDGLGATWLQPGAPSRAAGACPRQGRPPAPRAVHSSAARWRRGTPAACAARRGWCRRVSAGLKSACDHNHLPLQAGATSMLRGGGGGGSVAWCRSARAVGLPGRPLAACPQRAAPQQPGPRRRTGGSWPLRTRAGVRACAWRRAGAPSPQAAARAGLHSARGDGRRRRSRRGRARRRARRRRNLLAIQSVETDGSGRAVRRRGGGLHWPGVLFCAPGSDETC